MQKVKQPKPILYEIQNTENVNYTLCECDPFAKGWKEMQMPKCQTKVGRTFVFDDKTQERHKSNEKKIGGVSSIVPVVLFLNSDRDRLSLCAPSRTEKSRAAHRLLIQALFSPPRCYAMRILTV